MMSASDTTFYGAGQVLEMCNQTTEKLTVAVKVFRPTGNASHKFKRVLPELPLLKQDPTEIGHAEGWAFACGDEVEISSDGFRDLARLPISASPTTWLLSLSLG